MRRTMPILGAAVAAAGLMVACADGPTAPSQTITGPSTNLLDVQQSAIDEEQFYLQYIETGETGAIAYNDDDDEDPPTEIDPQRQSEDSRCGGSNVPGTSEPNNCGRVSRETARRLACENKGSCYSYRGNGRCVNTCGGNYRSTCQNGGVPPNCN